MTSLLIFPFLLCSSSWHVHSFAPLLQYPHQRQRSSASTSLPAFLPAKYFTPPVEKVPLAYPSSSSTDVVLCQLEKAGSSLQEAVQSRLNLWVTPNGISAAAVDVSGSSSETKEELLATASGNEGTGVVVPPKKVVATTSASTTTPTTETPEIDDVEETKAVAIARDDSSAVDKVNYNAESSSSSSSKPAMVASPRASATEQQLLTQIDAELEVRVASVKEAVVEMEQELQMLSDKDTTAASKATPTGTQVAVQELETAVADFEQAVLEDEQGRTMEATKLFETAEVELERAISDIETALQEQEEQHTAIQLVVQQDDSASSASKMTGSSPDGEEAVTSTEQVALSTPPPPSDENNIAVASAAPALKEATTPHAASPSIELQKVTTIVTQEKPLQLPASTQVTTAPPVLAVEPQPGVAEIVSSGVSSRIDDALVSTKAEPLVSIAAPKDITSVVSELSALSE